MIVCLETGLRLLAWDPCQSAQVFFLGLARIKLMMASGLILPAWQMRSKIVDQPDDVSFQVHTKFWAMTGIYNDHA